jgi:hypothetical protein
MWCEKYEDLRTNILVAEDQTFDLVTWPSVYGIYFMMFFAGFNSRN